MYRKIVWCYVLVLTLLDISLNTKLTAQGKSHDVTVQDSLLEGISFQEWGKDSDAAGYGGAGGAAEALRLAPAALRFGRAALGAAHALTVTLTNTHNTTVHLASVAGTTPDFHASFFESKTLPPNGNTSFNVVYLGRREGPVAAHLYIHTSLGVHKYPVSAEGVASEWGVWPLVGLRIPHNATLDPLLTLYNPTDKHIQVRSVYSSGAWVGLRLPGGGGAAPREAWRVPPHSSRALVRLHLRLPAAAAASASAPAPGAAAPNQRPLTAYIRIKGDMVGGSPGGLVVGVEATPAPPGAFLMPPQLRLRLRGSQDPPHTWDILAGNSGAESVGVEASVWGARCGRAPAAPPPPPPPAPRDHASANGQAADPTTSNGVKSEGAHVTVTRSTLDPHQEATPALKLTLDYARLWASAEGAEGGSGAEGGEAWRAEGAWCSGWVRVGAAALPYSVRLLPGTLRASPPVTEVVTANKEEAMRERELRVHNEFPRALRVNAIEYGPDVKEYFDTVELTPLVLAPGASGVALRLRLRPGAAGAGGAAGAASLASHVTLRTNLTRYTAPLLLHAGTLQLEWDWPNSADGHLRVGGVGAGSALRVPLRVRNPTPAQLCITDTAVRLPHASLEVDTQRCIPAGGWAAARLVLGGGAAAGAAGAVAGAVVVRSQHAAARAHVSLHVHAGRLRAHTLALDQAAPYAWASAPLELESTMSLSMRVLNVTQPQPDPALSFVPGGSGWVSGGRQTVGVVTYAPELACAPNCYTGLDLASPEGVAWLSRGGAGPDGEPEGLQADIQLLRARRAMFAQRAARPTNVSLLLHTSEVVGIPVSGSVRAYWPRLRAGAGAAGAAGAGGEPLRAGVGGAAALRLRARNPAAAPLVLHAALAPRAHHLPGDMHTAQDADGIESFCAAEACAWAADAFRVTSWRAVRGSVEPYARGNWTHAFLLAPAAELELTVTFAPAEPAPLVAYLYLRNNLTIVEIIPLWGRGAYPSFELGGRKPGSSTPLLFEVSECAGAEGAEGVVRRTVTLANTGPVGVRLRDWRVGGRACQARGFRLQPCAPLTLPPNASRALRLAYAPDYTLARAHAQLAVRTDTGVVEFRLAAAAPARLLRACGAAPGLRPPWEPLLRGAGTLLALVALALVLAAAAVDAERELRRARAARLAAPPAARAPLDLRLVAAGPAPPAPRAPPRRRRPARRPPPLDPHAERRAFERWRAEVLRRHDHSSEEADVEQDSTPPSDPIKPESRSLSPGTPDAARRSSDEEAASLSSAGSDSMRDADERRSDDSDRDEPAPPPAPPAPPAPGARPLRPRREASEPPRRSERREEGGRTRGGGGGGGAGGGRARRAGAVRRRGAGGEARAEAPAPREARAPPPLRWGATWSSVVAAKAQPPPNASNGSPAPLPPIGSDVRRRADERAGACMAGGAGGAGPGAAGADHSLFYFNGEQPPPAPAPDGYWRPERAAYPPPVPDYRPDYGTEDSSGLGGGFGSVWAGGGGAWAWGGALVRPPPGFNSPPPPPPRAYDPFRSLAAIWAPGALDWRPEPAPPAAAAAATTAPPAADPDERDRRSDE